jgi:hypothetical protein
LRLEEWEALLIRLHEEDILLFIDATVLVGWIGRKRGMAGIKLLKQ